eukprot:646215-Hanusia_phi.AAC.1
MQEGLARRERSGPLMGVEDPLGVAEGEALEVGEGDVPEDALVVCVPLSDVLHVSRHVRAEDAAGGVAKAEAHGYPSLVPRHAAETGPACFDADVGDEGLDGRSAEDEEDDADELPRGNEGELLLRAKDVCHRFRGGGEGEERWRKRKRKRGKGRVGGEKEGRSEIWKVEDAGRQHVKA